MSDDWFRGAAWDEAARDLFETKIKRAKGQKAFYLWVKAEAIAANHPDDAEVLFERALTADEEGFETARALNARSRVRAAQGAAGETLDDLARAARLEKTTVAGMVSPARWDYAALVATRRERARYDEALELLGKPVSAMSFAGQVALAFIHYDRGHAIRARRAARKALKRAAMQGELAPGVPLAPTPAFPDPLYDRLLVIAGLWDDAELGPPPPVWPEA